MQLRIVESVLAVNDNRKRAMARKVANAAGGNLRGKTVAILGLTFKPDTDDMREAPSIPLVTGLLDLGAKVRAHDPVGMEQARRELPDIEYSDDPYACASGADVPGDRDRIGSVPRARSRAPEARDGTTCGRRPPQYLSPRRYDDAGFYL